MPAILMLLAVAVGTSEPASQPQAMQTTAVELSTQVREQATNESLLAALKQKRAEIAQSPLAPNDGRRAESRRYALEFLDRQIAKIKKEMDR